MAKAKMSLLQAKADEEALKDQVYTYLDQELADYRRRTQNAQRAVRAGSYEDQDRFMEYGALADRRREEQHAIREFESVLKKPYFAHMSVNSGNAEIHFLLSDSADLESRRQVGAKHFIMPFKKSANAPMLTALFELYSDKRQGTFQTTVEGRTTTYQTKLLRDVDISERTLLHVFQYYPELSDETRLDADELLAQRLEENRGNARMRNIIATLQSRQFEIIRLPLEESFVVQGCAGSGKTQCLIHRLFFLRGELDERGWQKVLLITPTQLFRNYSADLMRRYHLNDVANISLANLYHRLLSALDPRFKSRQYEFEWTEEYLPDEYLRQVYAQEQIQKIDREIENAITVHVEDARRLLGMEEELTPDAIDINLISMLSGKLGEAVTDFDERAELHRQDAVFQEHLDGLAQSEKEVAALQKRLEALESAKEHLDREKAEFDRLRQEAANEKNEWEALAEQHNNEIEERVKDYNEQLNALQAGKETRYSTWKRYRKALYRVLDKTRSFGAAFQRDKTIKDLQEELCGLAEQNLADFTEKASEKTWLRRYSGRRRNNEIQRQIVRGKLEAQMESADVHRNWISEHTGAHESVQEQKKEYRDALEKARYYLARIESSVFEQEVWNALAPLKEKCGIQTLHIETDEKGRQKQTRLLYKSDLLFYLKIYLRLRGIKALPKYELICVDEGQDLHRVDYELLRQIFPSAALNIFGDTDQVLHASCGVGNWEEDSGVQKVFHMDINYRNTPGIVAFCNTAFQRNMKYIGSPDRSGRPTVCDVKQLRSIAEDPEFVLIVKDRAALAQLCRESGLREDEISFFDTRSQTAEAERVRCYSVFAAKGLEFPNVLVFARGMTKNQKIVACTRAMQRLTYCE